MKGLLYAAMHASLRLAQLVYLPPHYTKNTTDTDVSDGHSSLPVPVVFRWPNLGFLAALGMTSDMSDEPVIPNRSEPVAWRAAWQRHSACAIQETLRSASGVTQGDMPDNYVGVVLLVPSGTTVVTLNGGVAAVKGLSYAANAASLRSGIWWMHH